jgi:hypothetical protein
MAPTKRRRIVERRPTHEITTDGRTVWINGGPGGAIGRFGPGGVDVHNIENTGCLARTHGKPGMAEWRFFVDKMQEHHGIRVAAKYRPRWLDVVHAKKAKIEA